MFFRNSFLPKVTNIIKILIITLRSNNLKEDKGKNRSISEMVPTRLPNNNLFKEIILFNILLVPKRSRKSKKKLIIKTKSKYIFMISP